MSLRAAAAVILLALPACGADVSLPNLRIEPKAGGSIFFIKNVSAQPVTAYLIELVGYPGSSYFLWQDDLASGSDPIAPGAERRTDVANMTVGAVPDYVKVQAAVYVDGAVAGVPAKIKQLLERRRAILDTTRDLIQRLEGGATAESLKQLAQSAPKVSVRSQAGINQQAANKLILDTAASLEAHSVPDTLAGLRAKEKALASSQPSL